MLQTKVRSLSNWPCIESHSAAALAKGIFFCFEDGLRLAPFPLDLNKKTVLLIVFGLNESQDTLLHPEQTQGTMFFEVFQRPFLNTASDRLLDLDTGRNQGEDDHLTYKRYCGHDDGDLERERTRWTMWYRWGWWGRRRFASSTARNDCVPEQVHQILCTEYRTYPARIARVSPNFIFR